MSEEKSKITYTEALKLVIDKIEDIEDYVKSMDKKVDSIDDRERLLQKDLSRLHGMLEGQDRLKTEKKETKEEKRKDINLILGILALVVSFIISIASRLLP